MVIVVSSSAVLKVADDSVIIAISWNSELKQRVHPDRIFIAREFFARCIENGERRIEGGADAVRLQIEYQFFILRSFEFVEVRLIGFTDLAQNPYRKTNFLRIGQGMLSAGLYGLRGVHNPNCQRI